MSRKEKNRILCDVLGDAYVQRQELLFNCPACNHHKRKLSVNIDKNVFKCWICDYRGRNIRRIVRKCGTFTQLQKWDSLSGRIDFTKFEALFSEEKFREEKPRVDLPAEFISLCSRNIPATGRHARNYLRKRGLTDADIVRWKVGYCFEGEYRNRVVIHSFDDDGDASYFIARSYMATPTNTRTRAPQRTLFSTNYLLTGMKI